MEATLGNTLRVFFLLLLLTFGGLDNGGHPTTSKCSVDSLTTRLYWTQVKSRFYHTAGCLLGEHLLANQKQNLFCKHRKILGLSHFRYFDHILYVTFIGGGHSNTLEAEFCALSQHDSIRNSPSPVKLWAPSPRGAGYRPQWNLSYNPFSSKKCLTVLTNLYSLNAFIFTKGNPLIHSP